MERKTVGQILGNIFDKIYLINLRKDGKRYNKMQKLIKRYDIKFNRYNAIRNKKCKIILNKKKRINAYEKRKKIKIKNCSIYGCLQSHRNIIKHALKHKYKRILIFEDDVFAHKQLKKLLIKNYKLLKNNKWRLIYFGATKKQKRTGRIRRGNGGYAYGVDRRIFWKILSLTNNLKMPIDTYYHYIQSHYICYLIKPNLFIADVRTSNIRRNRNLRRIARKYGWNLKNYILY